MSDKEFFATVAGMVVLGVGIVLCYFIFQGDEAGIMGSTVVLLLVAGAYEYLIRDRRR